MNHSSTKLRTIKGAASWRFATKTVEAFVTRAGGHLAPVTFDTGAGKIQPYAIAPWGTEVVARGTSRVLRALRGDFFCMPFGENLKAWRGERHPPHGETACGIWRKAKLRSFPEGVEFSVQMRTKQRPGLVIKTIWLREKETNVYCEHKLLGFRGPMCMGHHAMLKFPPEEGCGHISIGPWCKGQVCPVPFESPARGGYSSLRTGARFADLRRVPLAAGGDADLSRYPARAGFEDLVMVSARPGVRLAWTAVAFPRRRYLWFSVKDPGTLASTILWHSNGGRHYAPWAGRHRQVLGLEEVTGNFHFGLAASASARGASRGTVPTVLQLKRKRPLMVRYIMGVVEIPVGFDSVRTVRLRDKELVFTATSGATISHAVDLRFFKRPKAMPGGAL